MKKHKQIRGHLSWDLWRDVVAMYNPKLRQALVSYLLRKTMHPISEVTGQLRLAIIQEAEEHEEA